MALADREADVWEGIKGHALASLILRSPPRKPAARICASSNCSTVLSVYNTTQTCSVHTPDRRYTFRVRR